MEKWAAVLLIAIIGFTFSLNKPPPTYGDKQAVKTDTTFHLLRHEYDADSEMVVRSRAGDELGSFVLQRNTLYESREQAESGKIDATVLRHYYLAEPGFDFGVWAGPARDPALDVGIRVSPLRLVYGSIALDGVFSSQCVGAGLSIYPPPDLFGGFWRHLGLGAYYVADTGSGDTRPVFSVSFSTKD